MKIEEARTVQLHRKSEGNQLKVDEGNQEILYQELLWVTLRLSISASSSSACDFPPMTSEGSASGSGTSPGAECPTNSSLKKRLI